MKKDRVKKLQKKADALCSRHNVLANENVELKKRADVLEDLLKVGPPGQGGAASPFGTCAHLQV